MAWVCCVLERWPLVELPFVRCIYNETGSIESGCLTWIYLGLNCSLVEIDSLRERKRSRGRRRRSNFLAFTFLLLKSSTAARSWFTHNGVVCTLLSCTVGIAPRGFSTSATETGASSNAA